MQDGREHARFAMDVAKHELEALHEGCAAWVNAAMALMGEAFPGISPTREAMMVQALEEQARNAVADEEARLREIISQASRVLRNAEVSNDSDR